MAANQAQLSRLLGALELYRRNPPPALLISPRSAEDAVRATILIRAVEPELARRAQAFRAEAEALQRVRRAIEAMSEDLFTSESALAEAAPSWSTPWPRRPRWSANSTPTPRTPAATPAPWPGSCAGWASTRTR